MLIHLVSASSSPIKGAMVRLYSGGLPYAQGLTDSSETVNLTIFSGTFNVQVFWEGVRVGDQIITITNSTSIAVPVNILDPTFTMLVADRLPLANAMVFITYPNGSTGRLPFTADSSGSVHLVMQPAGNYSLLVFYEGINVEDTTLGVNFSWTNSSGQLMPVSPTPYQAICNVYKLTVDVIDRNGAPLNNASVLVTGDTNGATYAYSLTENGSTGILLPQGTYNIQVEYHNVWWLTFDSNFTYMTLPLQSDREITVRMTNLPPQIWMTLEFWLIILPVLIIVLALVVYFIKRRS